VNLSPTRLFRLVHEGRMLIDLAVLTAALLGTAFSFRIFLIVVKADPAKFRKANKYTGSVRNAIRGELNPYASGVHSDEVAKGLVYSYQERRFVLQGRLAHEIVDSIGV
jgi:hypothetical protein